MELDFAVDPACPVCLGRGLVTGEAYRQYLFVTRPPSEHAARGEMFCPRCSRRARYGANVKRQITLAALRSTLRSEGERAYPYALGRNNAPQRRITSLDDAETVVYNLRSKRRNVRDYDLVLWDALMSRYRLTCSGVGRYELMVSGVNAGDSRSLTFKQAGKLLFKARAAYNRRLS